MKTIKEFLETAVKSIGFLIREFFIGKLLK